MGFDIRTHNLMEYCTAQPPSTGDIWSGVWLTILSTLFPISQDYIITPRRRVLQIPDLIMEVAKITNNAPLTFRTVLIVDIKDAQYWDHGKEALMQKIRRQTDLAFSGTGTRKLYWIGSIGPHWVYGEKEEDGQDLRPLIGWHDATHDDASYHDFLQLVKLVEASL
jgi:hypothetical protein